MERRVRVASMNHLQAPEHDFVQKNLDAFLSGGRPFMRNADRMKRLTCFDGGCSLTAPVCCGCARAAHGISSLRRTGNNNAALNIHAEANAFERSADLHMSRRWPSDKKPLPRQGSSQQQRERRKCCGVEARTFQETSH